MSVMEKLEALLREFAEEAKKSPDQPPDYKKWAQKAFDAVMGREHPEDSDAIGNVF